MLVCWRTSAEPIRACLQLDLISGTGAAMRMNAAIPESLAVYCAEVEGHLTFEEITNAGLPVAAVDPVDIVEPERAGHLCAS